MARIDAPVRELADVLEPDVTRRSAPSPSQDLAFAPTLHAPDPPSVDVDVEGDALRVVTPFAFPIASLDDEDLPTKRRLGILGRLVRAYMEQIAELRLLWAGTAEIIDVDAAALSGATGRVLLRFRRARTLWSFWSWSRADMARAALIGGAVFLVTASIGATVVASRPSLSLASGAEAHARAEVPRTVDQHTDRADVDHTKAHRRH